MLSALSLTGSAVAFGAAALVLLVVGVRFTKLVDRLADRTGIGEALAGAIFIGAVTSLPGLVTSLVGAAEGDASFAVSNSLGGIAVQTAFLALADLTYRRANLEHAAASLPNLLQSLGLITLVALVFVASSGPEFTVLGVHPVSLLLPVVYVYWLKLTRDVGESPMWRAEQTPETRQDDPDEDEGEDGRSLSSMWLEFGALAAVVAGTGYVVGQAGLSLAAATGLSSSFVGTVFSAVVTSLPELVTAVVAVRIGALTLAVGDIIGGNTFDVLFVAASDVVYREGSIYHAVDQGTELVLGLVVLLTAVLAAGLVRREEKGIGFEGYAILGLYVTGVVLVYALGGEA